MSDRPSREQQRNEQPASVAKSLRSQRRKIVNELAAELHVLREQNQSNYGVFNTFYAEKVGTCAWLKRDDLNNGLRRLIRNCKRNGNNLITGTINLTNNDKDQNIPADVSINENNSGVLSSLSSNTTSITDSSKKPLLVYRRLE